MKLQYAQKLGNPANSERSIASSATFCNNHGQLDYLLKKVTIPRPGMLDTHQCQHGEKWVKPLNSSPRLDIFIFPKMIGTPRFGH